MDLLFLSAEIVTRLQAGAAGSLVSILTSEPDPSASVGKRLFCGWVAAVFCAPLAISLAEAFLLSDKVLSRINRADAEMVSAFVVGLVGWRAIKFIHKRAAKFVKENE
jgi:hypothetical protein